MLSAVCVYIIIFNGKRFPWVAGIATHSHSHSIIVFQAFALLCWHFANRFINDNHEKYGTTRNNHKTIGENIFRRTETKQNNSEKINMEHNIVKSI